MIWLIIITCWLVAILLLLGLFKINGDCENGYTNECKPRNRNERS